MATFRVGYFPDFYYGDAVVLVGADRDGMHIFESAVRAAREVGQGGFELRGTRHKVVRQSNRDDIELGCQTVTWCFDDSRLGEILDMIQPLVGEEGVGHQYVDDVRSPAATVILSVDEYVDGGPFDEFPKGLPVPRP